MDFDKWRLFFYIYFVISLLPKLNSCKHCLKLLVRCCLFQVLKDIGCLQLKEETEIGQLELPVVQNRLSRFLGPTARLSRLPQSYEAWEWEGFLDVPGTVWLHENALCFLSAKVLLSYNVHNSSSFIEWYSSWSGVVCFSLIFLDLFPFFEICKGTSSVEATLGRIDWRQLTRNADPIFEAAKKPNTMTGVNRGLLRNSRWCHSFKSQTFTSNLQHFWDSLGWRVIAVWFFCATFVFKTNSRTLSLPATKLPWGAQDELDGLALSGTSVRVGDQVKERCYDLRMQVFHGVSVLSVYTYCFCFMIQQYPT